MPKTAKNIRKVQYRIFETHESELVYMYRKCELSVYKMLCMATVQQFKLCDSLKIIIIYSVLGAFSLSIINTHAQNIEIKKFC